MMAAGGQLQARFPVLPASLRVVRVVADVARVTEPCIPMIVCVRLHGRTDLSMLL